MVYQRFEEIDILRGIAVLLMLIYHFVYDLVYFGFIRANLFSGFWKIIARSSLIIFLLLVGVGMSLKSQKAKLKGTKQPILFKGFLKRGLEIFSLGLLISLVTKIVIGDDFVHFGILHLIGLSIIILFPLIKLKQANLIIGGLIISLDYIIRLSSLQNLWLLWLGVTPRNFSSIDYTPIIPWIGVIIIGIFLGNVFYVDYSRKFNLHRMFALPVMKKFCCQGKHSLLIYLIHQPILFSIMWVLNLFH